jgi:cytosine/adenosine deaminase-related metal-dependent hydrolase
VSVVRPPGHDADVPAFCRELGVPGLADVHVHFLPPRLLRRVWQYFDAAGPLVGTTWPIRYRWPDEQRVAHLRCARSAGTTLQACSGSPATAHSGPASLRRRHPRGSVGVPAPRGQARWSRRPMTKANPYSTPITISRKW